MPSSGHTGRLTVDPRVIHNIVISTSHTIQNAVQHTQLLATREWALTPTYRQKDFDDTPLLDITVSVLSRLVDRGLIARAAVDDEEDEEGQRELEAAQGSAASLGERFSTSRWHCRTRT